MIWVAYAGLLASAVAALYRLVVGPSLPDRVIALDLLLISLMSGIAIDAGVSGDTTFLKLLVAIAIIAFTATVASTAFIEREADRAGAVRGAARRRRRRAAEPAGTPDAEADTAADAAVVTASAETDSEEAR